MPPYPIFCSSRECGQIAVYKIAARWSDGTTEELKTYALSCADCLPNWYEQSRQKQAACRRTPGEILDPPGILAMVPGSRDRQLQRRVDLEAQLDPLKDPLP